MERTSMKRAAPLLLLAVLLTGCAAASASTGTQGAAACSGGPVGALSADQAANATAIAQVAMSRGLGPQGVLVGITAALTESTLINVNHGDAMGPSSIGLFQQMPSWGPLNVRTDPTGAAGLFYDALLKLNPSWSTMTVQAADQAVEQSQFSDGSNYAGNLAAAQTIASTVTATCKTTTPGGKLPQVAGLGGAIIAAAQTQLGVRYSWGGGDLNGPTVGIHDGGVADSFGDYAAIGWDCSALTRYAVYKATNGKVEIPRTAAAQRGAGTAVAVDQVQAGDLIVFGTEHVGIYIGNDQIVNAPQSGETVRVDSVTSGSNSDKSTWAVRRISLTGATQ